MTLVLLSIWTCVIGFAFLINSKYRLTFPCYMNVASFAIAGFLATVCAGYFNTFLMEASPMLFFSGSMINRFCSFMVGAGLGEEFWKMGFGLLLIMFMGALRILPRPSGRVLGMITVGMTFAMLENLIVYTQICDEFNMLRRSYLTVPLHACMGMIHGVSINKAIERQSFLPLFFGYIISAGIHTLFDTMDLFVVRLLDALKIYEFFPGFDPPSELFLGPLVIFILVWSLLKWHRVRELPLDLTPTTIDPDTHRQP